MRRGTPPPLFKVVTIGESGVGKSSLLLRFADHAFTESYISTIGVDFRFQQIDVPGKGLVKLQIWDTAGQERFRTITSAYYRAADGIVIVYDVCNRRSFEQLPSWIAELAKYDVSTLPILLIGNKCDRVADRMVTSKEGEDAATRMGIRFFAEASAKSGVNVESAFRSLSAAMLEGGPAHRGTTTTLRGGVEGEGEGASSESKSCC